MTKKDESKNENGVQPIVPVTYGLSVSGLTHHKPAPAQHRGSIRVTENEARAGVPLEKCIFSPDNPEIIWLFTDATEEQVRSAGLDPERIDQWGVDIEDDQLPDSPEFNTIDGCIAYLKTKILPIWQAQLR